MSLAAGTRLGHYEIVAPLGAGGMGEVYRARDTRLSRDVAVKVLPARLLENAEARTRFEREAKAVAALSHPNILSIHDFGEHEGAAYAVTELLSGETLAERLTAGVLPVRRVLELATQMAEGLAAAHEKGIIHRDLKPANLFITTDGRLKILDFGLARVGPSETDRTQTIAVGESTEPGTVLGTVHYMAPEQVRAGAVDHRSDIFSFGIVLYEMLTGKRPFQAESAVETMNAILRDEPHDSSSLNPGVPLGVERILRRCLEKKPEMRFQSARDLAFALGNTGVASSHSLPPGELAGLVRPTTGATAKLRPALMGLALLIAGGALGAFVAGRLRPAAVLQPVKITRLTHSGRDWNPSASPDGRMLAFTSQRDGRTRIWLRQMKGGMEVPLTEGSDFSPRFSPDGSSVLFLRGEGSLREAFRVPVVGGQARRVLADVSEATWSPDGARLAFLRPSGQAVDAETAIGVADLQGGAERELSRVKGRFLYGLDWSPDGRWLSMASTDVVQNAPNNTLYLVDVKSSALNQNLVFPTRLSMPTWDPASRTLTLARSLSLVGDVSNPLGRVVRLDPLTGRERAVFWVQSVFTGGSDVVRFDSIGDSTLVFDEYDWSGSLEELDLGGALPAKTGRLLTHGSSRDRQPCYSRAGDTIIFSSNRSGNLDLWTINVTTGEVRQVTDDAAEDWDPAFTVDGRGILWSSSRGGHLEIWTAATDGTGARQLSHDGDDAENPTQTADGAFVVYASGSTGKGGIWRIRSDGTDPLKLITGANYLPEVSPDGRYVSYALQDTPRNLSLLVVSEVATGRQVFQTSMLFGGFQAVVTPGRSRWTPDGRTLVFVAPGEAGRGALYAQDFRPGQDTIASRRLLATAGGDDELESFGLSPDGRHVTIARIATSRCLKLAEGVPGLQ